MLQVRLIEEHNRFSGFIEEVQHMFRSFLRIKVPKTNCSKDDVNPKATEEKEKHVDVEHYLFTYRDNPRFGSYSWVGLKQMEEAIQHEE